MNGYYKVKRGSKIEMISESSIERGTKMGLTFRKCQLVRRQRQKGKENSQIEVCHRNKRVAEKKEMKKKQEKENIGNNMDEKQIEKNIYECINII